jgi:hypothetical protein
MFIAVVVIIDLMLFVHIERWCYTVYIITVSLKNIPFAWFEQEFELLLKYKTRAVSESHPTSPSFQKLLPNSGRFPNWMCYVTKSFTFED